MEFTIKEIDLRNPEERAEVERFLENLGLQLEEGVEYTLALKDQSGEIIGTGSFEGKVLKCIGVDPDYQEAGLASKIVSALIQELRNRGRFHYFIFTSPDGAERFKELGFRELARGEPFFVLLEGGIGGIDDYISYLKENKVKEVESASGCVVNCNPFTLGHQHLIETASSKSEFVYVIVVEEERSLFPFNVRFRLVKEGTKHLKNVKVLKGGDYAVSSATFPSYFLRGKESLEIALSQARLDVSIFAKYIAPALGIKKRFVAEEPYCPVTAQFNKAMKEILPKHGIELIEILRRRTEKGEIISASTVRELIRKDAWEDIKRFVPKTTYDFLISEEAKPIIERIKKSRSRH